MNTAQTRGGASKPSSWIPRSSFRPWEQPSPSSTPRVMIRNPVMFVVEVVAVLTTVLFLKDLATGGTSLGFSFQIILWLWFTLLFANFAEAVAEGRGKAQAAPCARRGPRRRPSCSPAHPGATTSRPGPAQGR